MELPGPLVPPEWLETALHDGVPGLAVVDVRWKLVGTAREAYEGAHIPGAAFIDLNADLSGPVRGYSGRHPLPSPQAFARAMERAGVGDDSLVVAYDDAGGSVASRLWWMLAVTGHRVGVLDGGLQAWEGKTETGPPPKPPGGVTFTGRPWPVDRMATAEQVNRLRRDPGTVVIDGRAAERYRGEAEPIDPVAGHIPGAVNVPWAENVDPATGMFRNEDDLRKIYADKGTEDREVIVYCGSGTTACHNLLALEAAGIKGARLYVGSWSGWIADGSRPMARGIE